MDVSKFNFDFEKIVPIAIEEATKIVRQEINSLDTSNYDLTQNLQEVINICIKHSVATTTLTLSLYNSALMNFLKDA